MMPKNIFESVDDKIKYYANSKEVENSENLRRLEALEDFSDELLDNITSSQSYINEEYENCIEQLGLLVQVIVKIALQKMNMLKTIELEEKAKLNKINKSRKLKSNSGIIRVQNSAILISEINVKIEAAMNFYVSFPKEGDLKRVLNFVQNAPNILMKEKHLSTLLNIPELMDTDSEIFKNFMKAHNSIVNKNELKRLEEARKKEEEAENEVKSVKNEETKIIDEPKEKIDKFSYAMNEEYMKPQIEEELYNLAELFINNFYSGNDITYLLDLLPSKNDPKYYKIGDVLLNRFDEEYSACLKALTMYDDPTFKNRIEFLELYIKTLRSYFSDEEVAESLVQEDILTANNIYYAHTTIGNSYIEGDLSSTDFEDKESKESLITLIDKIQKGNFSYSFKESRKFTQNKDLKGVYELKKGAARLIFLRLPSNNIFIIMAVVKRSQNATYDINRIKERVKQTNEEYRLLKEDLLSEETEFEAAQTQMTRTRK